MPVELEHVTKILAQVEDIPTLSTTLAEVLRIVDDPYCSATRLGSLVTADPPLAARVLRLANSAYYGFPRAIAAVPQAITLLGFAALRNVALSAGVFDAFRHPNGGADLDALWKHSVCVAASAKIVARRVRFSPVEKAFTAGLLHDIGRVIIARYMTSSLEDIFATIETEDLTIGEAEQRILGVSHPAFGAWLAARWSFPPSLVDAIAYHHQPMRTEASVTLPAVVHIADALAHRIGADSGADTLPRAIDPAVLQYLGLAEPDIDELAAALLERQGDVEAFASALGKH